MCHMYKLYNTIFDFSSNISNFLLNISSSLHKPQLKFFSPLISSIILSESIVRLDIAKSLHQFFPHIKLPSLMKRISRFCKSDSFDPYLFYDNIISHVISSYKLKHNDNRVHIVLDHMYSHHNFTVFMISMRVGKQSIPLWFRCFSGQYNPEAFKFSLLKEGILFVHNLFKDKNIKLVFLADRWFDSTSLMSLIDSLDHTFVFRIKRHRRVLIFDNKEGHRIWKPLDHLFAYQFHSNYFHNVSLTKSLFSTNIVIGKKDNVKEP